MTQWDTARDSASVVALVGDSITRNETVAGPLRTALRASYGNAGDGWLSAAFGSPVASSTVTKTGTWTTSDAAATSFGADLSHVSSTDTATPGAIEFTSPATDVVLHYQTQTGGGSFRYQIDGGAWTTVSTDAAAAHDTVSVSGLSLASHTLRVEVTVAGNGVIIGGADAQVSGDGVRVHNLGNSSTASTDWLAVDATIWQDGLAALAPDVVIICLGPNDRGTGALSPATFADNIRSMAARVRAALPDADIVLQTPVDQGFSATGGAMWQFAESLYQAARRGGYPFVNTFSAVGDYPVANARGYYSDTTHPSASGGAVIASTVAGFLTA